MPFDAGQSTQDLRVPDHDQLPRLAVGSAPRPARHLEDVVHDLTRHRVGPEAPHGPQGPEKGYAVLYRSRVGRSVLLSEVGP